MAINTINAGSTPNDGTGDSIRVAFQKANDNFSFLQTSIINLVANSVVVNNVTRLEGGGLFTGTFRIRNTDLDQYFDIATTNQTFAGGTVAGATQFTSTQEATAIGSGGAVQVTGGFGVAGRSFFNQVFASNITVSAGLNITTANAINASLANISVANLDTGLVFATDGIITFGNVNAANLVLGENGQITFGDSTTLASALQTLTSNAAVQSQDLTTLLANSVTQATEIQSLQANIAAANVTISTLGALDVGALTSNISSLQNGAVLANTTISTIDANLGSLNTSVGSINANLGAYQQFANLSISTTSANIGNITVNFESLDANIGSFQTFSNANAVSSTVAFNTLEANVGTIRLELDTAEDDIQGANSAINELSANITAANTALVNKTFASLSDVNVATISGGQTITFNAISSKFEPADLGNLSVGNADTLDGFDSAVFATAANVGAYQTYANAVLSTQDANLGTATTTIGTAAANVGAYQTYANAVLSTQDANLGTATTTIGTLFSNAATQHTEIQALQANIAAANTAISVLDANLGAVTGAISGLGANLAGVTNNISTLFTNDSNFNANIGTFQTYANLGFSTVATTSALDANIGTFQTYANLGFSTVATTSALDANIGTFQTYANLGFSTVATTSALDANIGAFQTYANLGFSTVATTSALDANIGTFQTYANSNLAGLYSSITTLDSNIGAFQSYANISFAPVFQPSFSGGRIDTDGNLVAYGGNAAVFSTSQPAAEIGAEGDHAGRIYADAGNVYVCFNTYNGNSPTNVIWARIPADSTPWT